MELVDIYDKDGKYIRTQDRTKEINEYEFIKTVHIFIVNKNNEIYIQQRSENKKENPNLWETAGGAVQSGENLLIAAKREIEEESGIIVSTDDLIFLGSLSCDGYLVTSYVVFLTDSTAINPQLEEVKNIMYVSLNEIKDLIAKGRFYSTSFELFRKYYEGKVYEKI